MTVKEKMVTIRHPELGESVVMKSAVKVWQSQGWEIVGPTYPQGAEPEVNETEVPGDDQSLMFDFNQEDEPSEASEKE